MTAEPDPSEPDRVEPDTKDWTWVLERACPECRFDATVFTREDLSSTLTANAESFDKALTALGGESRQRPAPGVWSPLEYAAHVRDVHRLFDQRLHLMLENEDPEFANWDQDATAVEERYDLQDPGVVREELLRAAAAVAQTYAAVPDDAWDRTGRRSNGSRFTVDTLGRYHLHDVVHHLWDIGFDPRSVTVTAYDDSTEAYRDGTAEPPAGVLALVDRYAAALSPGSRVLEIGSGPGRDARLLEDAGLSVRRTDVTAGFVALMREQGEAADLLDPRTDDLSDPQSPGRPYDGVWASASLLHVARSDLITVLTRLAEATRPGGVLHLAVKEGDGEAWSTHGNVAAPRLFTFWREGPLREQVSAAGWDVVDVAHEVASPRAETWLDLIGRRR